MTAGRRERRDAWNTATPAIAAALFTAAAEALAIGAMVALGWARRHQKRRGELRTT